MFVKLTLLLLLALLVWLQYSLWFGGKTDCTTTAQVSDDVAAQQATTRQSLKARNDQLLFLLKFDDLNGGRGGD